MNYVTTSTSTDPPVIIKVDYNNNKDYIFPSTCDRCPNNPKNGGSGICFCTIGITPITC